MCSNRNATGEPQETRSLGPLLLTPLEPCGPWVRSRDAPHWEASNKKLRETAVKPVDVSTKPFNNLPTGGFRVRVQATTHGTNVGENRVGLDVKTFGPNLRTETTNRAKYFTTAQYQNRRSPQVRGEPAKYRM